MAITHLCSLAFVVVLLVLGAQSHAFQPLSLRISHLRRKISSTPNKIQNQRNQSPPPYQTKWISLPVDHFSFLNGSRFNLRVLVADKFYSDHGPMLFYSGNEGSIEDFYTNTGFMFELAESFNALIVFAEHRMYGKSKVGSNEDLTYLTQEQAMADFAHVALEMKGHYPKLGNIITFGGSYGGMLSAGLMRKYPHIFKAALAASAPVLQFPSQVDPYKFMKIVTDDFYNAGCGKEIREGFNQLKKEASQGHYSELTKQFRTCQTLHSESDVRVLNQFLQNGLVYLAMLDYSTPTHFLQPLPAWPVQTTCDRIKAKSLGGIASLVEAANVYFNTTGDKKCFDIYQQGEENDLGFALWNYQACTEMIMPVATNGESDFFLPEHWNLDAYVQYCASQKFGKTPPVDPRPYFYKLHYGFADVKSMNNVIYSNGVLDPWSGGGVFSKENPSVRPLIIEQGAHHADLRFSEPSDPKSIVDARAQEKKWIEEWLKE